ncbi:MAG: glycosyltransferase [Candidatus Omnitrophota bacterium]|jgi:GT2 family glycosyltransferase
MSNRLTSAVIVTCGFGNYFADCLDSCLEQESVEPEIIIIDNSLDRDFSQSLIKFSARVKIYSQKTRLSYCQSLNLGINQSKGEFVLCLNDDVRLKNDFLLYALKGFAKNPDIGMVSGKILRFDQETIDSAGLFLSPYLSAQENGYMQKDTGKFDHPGYVFGVSGSAALYRRQMLEQVKIEDWYFDPDFAFFYEDLDIAWRAKKKNWLAYYLPEAVAYHARGGSLRSAEGIGKIVARRYLNDQLCARLIINRYLTIIRNAKISQILLRAPLCFLYELCAWAYMLIFRLKATRMVFLKKHLLLSAIKSRLKLTNQ